MQGSIFFAVAVTIVISRELLLVACQVVLPGQKLVAGREWKVDYEKPNFSNQEALVIVKFT